MTAKKKSARKTRAESCPYLGLRDDPDAHMSFTSPLNHCHRGRSPASVKLEHQGEYCLDVNHSACPVYTDGTGKSFPRKLRGRGVKRSDYVYPVSTRSSWLPWLVIIVVLILSAAAYWFMRDDLTLIAISSPTPYRPPLASDTPVPASIAPTEPLSSTPDSTSNILDSTQTVTVTPFPTLTLTPAQTTTFTVTPPLIDVSISTTPGEASSHSLEMPIGPVQKYLIHQVSAGENLTGLATRYKTSVDAIVMVNVTLKVPIREGSVVIMPLDLTNPTGLPALEPYQVEIDQILVEAQAAELGTDPDLLKYFNLFVDGEILRKGDWILIPRVRPEAP